MSKELTKQGDQQAFIQQLNLSEESAALLRTLTEDIIGTEANIGRAMFDMGRKLGMVRLMLKEKGVDGAWEKWCECFQFTKDYANRMIQVSEVFKDAESVPANLTFRHFREVARFNYHSATEGDVAKLAKLVSAAGLNTKDTRQLVSAANAGKVDVDLASLSESSPKLRKQLEEKLKQAREMGLNESNERLSALQKRVDELSTKGTQLEADLKTKETEVKELAKKLKYEEAAEKLGDGDGQVGKLQIQLEQAVQAKDTALLELKEVARDAQQARQTLERFLHSPAGQARNDIKKAFEDLSKYFKDTMTPAYLALRVHRVNNPETSTAVLGVVDSIEEWCRQVRTQLATPVAVQPEVLPPG